MSNDLPTGSWFRVRGLLNPIADHVLCIDRYHCAQLISLARRPSLSHERARLSARASDKTTLPYSARRCNLFSHHHQTREEALSQAKGLASRLATPGGIEK